MFLPWNINPKPGVLQLQNTKPGYEWVLHVWKPYLIWAATQAGTCPTDKTKFRPQHWSTEQWQIWCSLDQDDTQRFDTQRFEAQHVYVQTAVISSTVLVCELIVTVWLSYSNTLKCITKYLLHCFLSVSVTMLQSCQVQKSTGGRWKWVAEGHEGLECAAGCPLRTWELALWWRLGRGHFLKIFVKKIVKIVHFCGIYVNFAGHFTCCFML